MKMLYNLLRRWVRYRTRSVLESVLEPAYSHRDTSRRHRRRLHRALRTVQHRRGS